MVEDSRLWGEIRILNSMLFLGIILTSHSIALATSAPQNYTRNSANMTAVNNIANCAALPIFEGEIGFTHNHNHDFVEFLRETAGEVLLDVTVDMSMWSDEQDEIFEQCNQMSPDYDVLDGGEAFSGKVIALPLGVGKPDPNDTECGLWMKLNPITEPVLSSGGSGLLFAKIKGVFELSSTYSGFGFTYYLDEK